MELCLGQSIQSRGRHVPQFGRSLWWFGTCPWTADIGRKFVGCHSLRDLFAGSHSAESTCVFLDSVATLEKVRDEITDCLQMLQSSSEFYWHLHIPLFISLSAICFSYVPCRTWKMMDSMCGDSSTLTNLPTAISAWTCWSGWGSRASAAPVSMFVPKSAPPPRRGWCLWGSPVCRWRPRNDPHHSRVCDLYSPGVHFWAIGSLPF